MQVLTPLLTSFVLCLALVGCQEKAETPQNPAVKVAKEEGMAKAPSGEKKIAARYHGWKTVSPAAFSAVQKVQFEKAETVKKATGKQLKGTLMGAMKDGGPVSAIGLCEVAAPAITNGIKADDVRIGRTSHKLRNQKNRAPNWATDLVKDQVDMTVSRVASDGTLGVLFPIKTGAACLNCHGDASTFAEGVAPTLKDKYPQDAATGYKEGDVRGYFWLEVPETAS